MQIIKNPLRKNWAALLQRPSADNTQVLAVVQAILQKVKAGGDEALKAYSLQFDDVRLTSFEVSATEAAHALATVSDELKKAIQQAKANIEAFHRQQVAAIQVTGPMPGIRCWRKSVGIEKVGLYIPGGTAPLFSTVLMLAIPALIAGCREIILCTPCGKDGQVHPAVLYTAHICGIKKVFKAGGAQAIAAMAYGTESIPQVYKIFGPGNQYVTAAKQLVQLEGMAIDMPAGPSEVAVLADDSADARFIAADLLSQAEHGGDSQVLLITTSEKIADNTAAETSRQLQKLPRKEAAAKALDNSKIIVVDTIEHAIELANAYAAEHLILCCNEAEAVAEKISNAGSVFIGNYSPESVGDYASGTNHTLPTNGFARAYSGVSVDSFVKKITFQQLTPEGLQAIGKTVMTMAQAEGLQAHAEAVNIRLAESSQAEISQS